jgi:hypothetical protein
MSMEILDGSTGLDADHDGLLTYALMAGSPR